MKLFSETCPDCGCLVGQPHRNECDVERCSVCGFQRISCGECKGHDSMVTAWTGRWPEPSSGRKSYHVIEEDFDTRIHECEDYEGEYETFQQARDAAVEYLEELIASCQSALEGIKY